MITKFRRAIYLACTDSVQMEGVLFLILAVASSPLWLGLFDK